MNCVLSNGNETLLVLKYWQQEHFYTTYATSFSVTEHSFGNQHTTASDFLPTAVTKAVLGGHRCRVRTADTGQAVAVAAPHATRGPIQFPPLGGVFFSLMKPVPAVTGSCLSMKLFKYNMIAQVPRDPAEAPSCTKLTVTLNGLSSEVPKWSSLNLPRKGAVKDWILASLYRQTVGNQHPVNLEKQLNTELDNSPAQSVLFC